MKQKFGELPAMRSLNIYFLPILMLTEAVRVRAKVSNLSLSRIISYCSCKNIKITYNKSLIFFRIENLLLKQRA